MKKNGIIIFLAIIIAVIGIGSYYYINNNQPKTTGLPMKLTKNNWPGKYFVEIAEKKGWFKDAGLNVELTDVRADYFGSLVDTVDGKYDGSDFYLYDFIQYKAGGSDLVVVLNPDISFGADALVAKPEIMKVMDLKGKTIGLPKGSNEEYGLSVVLERSGLKLKDVIIKDMPGEELGRAFINGEVDAIFTWEPFVSEVLTKGAGHKLFDSSEIPGLMPVVFAFHQKFINERPGDVQAFVNVWDRTVKFMKENPDEANQIIADIYNVTPKEIADFISIDKVFDLEANRIAFLESVGFESLHGVTQQVVKFLFERGVVDNAFAINKTLHAQFFDDRFVKKLLVGGGVVKR